MMSPLVQKYGGESRWINWKLVKEITKDGKTRDNKIPYYSKNNKASSTDPKTWATYEEVSQRLDNGSNGFDGIAVVLKDKKLICIDIDKVLTNGVVVHEKAEEILKLLKASDSFTEVSQSKSGLHVFMELGFEFKPIANKKEPFEVYTIGRYICTTGNSYHKEVKDIRLIKTEEELLSILSTIGYPWDKKEVTSTAIISSDTKLTDQEILEKMFKAKNGKLLKKLYEGDTTAYDDDESRADMALLSTLAFYSQRNASQMESIWKSSPLGQRKKTQERKDYRDRSIENAIANCKNVYAPKSKNIETDVSFFTKRIKDMDVIIPCKENVLIALRITNGLNGKLRQNLWTKRTEVFEDEKWRPIEDNDINIIRSFIANSYRNDIALVASSKNDVISAIEQYAFENAVDPAIEFFKSLVWDGVPRLDTWIQKAYNTTGYEESYKAFGRQWLKGLVKRVVEPGCKFDYVLVLEGPQGIRKSMSFSTLTSKDWHNEIVASPSDKDFFMLMQGKMIVEFSEGETHDRASSKMMKSVITRMVDTYRNPYGRFANDNYRRCVFAMSVNDLKYLRDETGNRRYLPVKCGKSINIEWLAENREQLFAEAYHYAITLGENIYEGLNTEEIRNMQEDRRQERYEETRIVYWYEGLSRKEREEGFTLEEVFDMAIAKEGDRFNQLHNNILPPILEHVLKLQRVRKTQLGRRRTVYIPTEETYKKFPVDEEDDLFTLPEVEVNF